MKKCLAVIIVLALVAVLIPGCSAAQSDLQAQSPEDSINFRLLISDEPNEINNFSSLNVTITQIGLKEEGGSGNWTTANITPPETVNLKELIGDNATAIWSGEVPTGNFTKVFIYADNVTGVLNSENVTVKLPSDKLQISKPFTISEDFIVDFVFDITVIKAGESGKYILKPQIAESGPNMPFNDITPQGTGQGEATDLNTGKPKGERLKGSISVVTGNETFEMQVSSDNWTVDWSDAKAIKGMPADGLKKDMEVVVTGIVTDTYSIKAVELKIEEED